MVIISPNLVKKFATCKGGADKAAMVEAMPEKLVDEIKEANYKKTTGLYDIADAYWIAKYTLEEYKKNELSTKKTTSKQRTETAEAQIQTS